MSQSENALGGDVGWRQPPGEDFQRTRQVDRFGGKHVEQQRASRGVGVYCHVAPFEQQQTVQPTHVVGMQDGGIGRVQTRGTGRRDQQATQQRSIVQLRRGDAGQFRNQVYHGHGLRRPHATHDNPLRAFRQGRDDIDITSLARTRGSGVISGMATPTVFTLPNLVSSSRVVLAVGFVAFDVVWARFVLICVASFSDFLDGWIARRTKAASRFGALIDPVADRFFVVAVVATYVAGGQLAWWQAVAILFRDVMSVIGFFVARNVSWLRPITFKARFVGKAVTVVQLATFLAVLALPEAVDALVIVVALLGLVATVDYTLMLWRKRTRAPVQP